MSETPYADFIRLGRDADGIRHVRTPEGAAFFHLPVGSPISEALYQKIKAEHKAKGHQWPKGMTVRNAKKAHTGGLGKTTSTASAADAAQDAAHKAPAAPTPPAPIHTAPAAPAAPHKPGEPSAALPEQPHVPVPPQDPSPVKASTLEGPNKFSVGTVKYSAPTGSRIYTPTNNSGLAFIVTPDGEIHAFNAKGEIAVSDPIVKAALTAKFTPDFQGDTNYAVGAFDPVPGPNDLPNLPDGSTLNDASGTPQFTKTGPDEWTHNGLGLPMSSADVQPFIDSGELNVGQAAPNHDGMAPADFASMDQPTFISTLEAFPVGKKIYWGSTVLTKTEDGHWANGKHNASSKDLWFIKNTLNEDKAAATEDLPAATEDVPAEPNAPEAKTPTEDVPTPEAPAEKTPAAEAPAEKTPAAEAPAEKTPAAEKAATDLAEHEQIASVKQLTDLAPGSHITSGKGVGAWEKKQPGMFGKKAVFQNVTTKATAEPYEFKKAIEDGNVHLQSHGKPETSSESETKDLKHGDEVSLKELNDVAVGKGITVDAKAPQGSGTSGYTHEYRKTGDDSWQKVKTNGIEDPKPWTTSKLAQFLGGDKNKKISYNDHPSEDLKEEKQQHLGATPQDQIGKPKVEEPLPGEYKSPEQQKVEESKATEQPKAEALTYSDTAIHGKISANMVSGMAPGDRIFDHGTNTVWTKLEDGKFAVETEGKVSGGNQGPLYLQVSQKDANFTKMTPPPKEKLASLKDALAPKPKTFEDLKHGDTISPEHVAQMKPGDQIKTSGDGQAVKTKQEDGTFLHHVVGEPQNAKPANMSTEEFAQFAQNGSLVKHAPTTPEVPSIGGGHPAVGAVVKDVKTLEALPPATVLNFTRKDGSIGQYTKLHNGNWLNPGGVQYHSNLLHSGVNAGKFTVHSYPNSAGSVPEHEQNTLSLVPGGKVYSAEHLTAALNALQNHPSHQIAYGLKSLDPSNLLHESHDGNQQELKIGAASEFPNLKGKPGAIALLKKKLGIEDNPLATTAATTDEPKVTIHAGEETHPFTKTEIDEAKKILEDYKGKLWANELSKKGSPLGVLKWNDVVGFHKDKEEGKKAAIQLLDQKSKQFLTKLPSEKAAEPPVEEPKVEAPKPVEGLSAGDKMSYDQLTKAKPGTTLHWAYPSGGPGTSEPYNAVKQDNGDWVTESGMTIPGTAWKSAATNGYVTFVSGPNNTEAPKEDAPNTGMSWSEFQNAKPGDVVSFRFKNGNTAIYGKTDSGTWIKTDDSTQTPRKETWFQTFFDQNLQGTSAKVISSQGDALPDYAAAPAAVTSKTDHSDIEADTGHNQAGVLPGKWTSSTGSYMIVNADGTGKLYAISGGTASLTPAKVKAMNALSMKTYEGIPEETPTPHVETAAATPVKTTPAAKKVAAKKKALPKVALEDGTYYLGNPDSYTTTTYTVKNGEATIKYNSGTKYGTQEVVPVEKLKTNFFAGKILDANGNSVLPEGHSGSMTMWNTPMTTQALLEAKNYLESKDENGIFHMTTQDALKKLGFYASPVVLKNKIGTANPSAYSEFGSSYGLNYTSNPENGWNVEGSKLVLAQINEFLKHVDTSKPESTTAGLFDWTTNGEAQMPSDLVPLVHNALVNSYDTAGVNAAFAAVTKHFGAKNLGGVTLKKNDKYLWLDYFAKGDFKSMYGIEVQAVSNKGLAHPSGYLHPGYEGNADTHNISWAAAVPGEIKADGDVPGDWSDVPTSSWSKEELSNYLISAQMQNPEHLSVPEQRQWVTFHRAGQKLKTDNLSVLAAQRKAAGLQPLAETPVWTDNIVPAKLYDSLFDENPFPTSNKWAATQYEVSSAWAKDNWDNAEFQKVLQDNYGVKDSQDGYSKYVIEAAVGKYFDQKHEEYQAELLKPVYSHVKKLAGGSHDVHLYQDQFGKKYVFKPVDNEAQLFRAEVEDASSKLGTLWGYNTPKTSVTTMEVPGKGEQTGLMQNFQDSISDFRGENGQGIDLSTLTDKQLGQLAAEHVLDWAIDNDDAHEENMLITPSGDLVGIDKGRGLYVFGNWNGLTGDSGAHTNMLPGSQLAYTPLYNGIRDGSISKEQADAAYFAAMKAADRIKKSDDAKVVELIQAGVAHRTKWSPPGYMTHFDHTQAPKNADDLVQAVLNRKAQIDSQVQDMWKKIYQQAGLGALPEKPAHVLGEDHLSGWSEPQTFDKVAETKVWGSAPLHSSPEFTTGHSLLWTEKTPSGETTHFGSFKVGAISQQKLVTFLEPKAGSAPAQMSPQAVSNFPALGEWKSALSAAGKDATKNAIDKKFDPEIEKKFSETKAFIEGDLAHWSPNLTADGYDMIQFPSGKSVPVEGLDQYKLALNHYQELASKVENAKATSTSTNKGDFSLYTPLAYAAEPKIYQNADSSKGVYKQLSNGSFIHSTPDGKLEQSSLPTSVSAGEDGWTLQGSSDHAPVEAAIYTKAAAGSGLGTLENGGIKTQKEGEWGTQGHQGQEYQITLPTGEKIFFRDSGATYTSKSQSGLIRFQLSGADQAGSLARVEAHLQTMGLHTEGADEEDAKTVYWRKMFDRVLMSNTNGAPTAVKSAKSTLQGMRADLSKKLGGTPVTDETLVEALGLSMTRSEEAAFWKDLADKTFGAGTVSAWIAAGHHLPQYSHMDLTNPEANTGQPYWNRIDVNNDDLLAKKTMLAIGNNGKDKSLLNYITSGGMLSTEERLRVLGYFKDGASSTQDQGSGGATGVFTRIAVPGHGVEKQGSIYGAHVAYWNPSVMRQIGTYSYTGDEYGNTSYLQDHNKFDPLKSMSSNTSNSNETLVQHQLSILDHLEIMVFSDPSKRNEAIQRMKAMGHDTLRGVPIEDRLVMQANLEQAMKAVKAVWTQQ